MKRSFFISTSSFPPQQQRAAKNQAVLPGLIFTEVGRSGEVLLFLTNGTWKMVFSPPHFNYRSLVIKKHFVAAAGQISAVETWWIWFCSSLKSYHVFKLWVAWKDNDWYLALRRRWSLHSGVVTMGNEQSGDAEHKHSDHSTSGKITCFT